MREREREKPRNKNMGCSQSKIEIGIGGFRSAWDHGWMGFKSAWVALAWRGPCVVVGRGWSSMLVASCGVEFRSMWVENA